jgi:hypothetical protein
MWLNYLVPHGLLRMILTNLNKWAIVFYLRRSKEGKGVPHTCQAVPCATRTRHTYFYVEKSVTCDLRRAACACAWRNYCIALIVPS